MRSAKRKPGLLFLKQAAFLCTWVVLLSAAGAAQSSLAISNVVDNRNAYADGRIPRYEKLEISFQIENTVAANLQMPYDAAPPQGVPAGLGITVNALFTPDNWQTVYTQPAFYYQEFLDETRSRREWFYPTGNCVWKARFAPNSQGTWQYKLMAQDAGGTAYSDTVSFVVAVSPNRGFLRVSPQDSRYFEFEDGTYFPALGYNMNYDHLSWTNPQLDNQGPMQAMASNGIQLIRLWLSQWGIYGSEWNPWNSQNPEEHGTYLPSTAISFSDAYPGSDVSMRITASRNTCMFIGVWKARPAVKRNTAYRVRVRYKTRSIAGPIDSTRPYGLVAKTGDWLWSDDEAQRCYAPGTGTVVTPHQGLNTQEWEILEGSLNSGYSDFLPNFYLVMENTTQGEALIDYVWIEENLGNGSYGPNIVSKPWMAHHWYFEQRNSYAFDKLLDLARANGVYLRPVIMEKNDGIFNRIDFNGNPVATGSNGYFYGDYRQPTKVRWLQKAWWRYLQARWGYSANIHSWELLNEGDPFDARHYTLADEFGKYMHQFSPNRHMVSTSNWHSFPKSDFWANSNYPDIDFADVHLYVPKDATYSARVDSGSFAVGTAAGYPDTAAASRNLGDLIGAKRPQGAGKPVIRGETGFVVSGSGPLDSDMVSDRSGIWLHNFIWAGVSPGGLIESYWYENGHIYARPDGADLRFRFKSYYDFIKGIPLNNGRYDDAAAASGNSQVRVWGQKDIAGGRAHLWIQNTGHHWRNAVAGITPAPATGSIGIAGFAPNTTYKTEWWDTYSGTTSRSATVASDSNGKLTLDIVNLITDTAVRIGDYGDPASPPVSPKNLRLIP